MANAKKVLNNVSRRSDDSDIRHICRLVAAGVSSDAVIRDEHLILISDMVGEAAEAHAEDRPTATRIAAIIQVINGLE